MPGSLHVEKILNPERVCLKVPHKMLRDFNDILNNLMMEIVLHALNGPFSLFHTGAFSLLSAIWIWPSWLCRKVYCHGNDEGNPGDSSETV